MSRVPCHVKPSTCGRTACQNDAMAFWQSRDPEHRVMHLTDLPQLAKDIRRAATTPSPYHIAAAVNTTPAPANPCVTIAELYELTCSAIERYPSVGRSGTGDAPGRADSEQLSERGSVLRGSRPTGWVIDDPIGQVTSIATPTTPEVTDHD